MIYKITRFGEDDISIEFVVLGYLIINTRLPSRYLSQFVNGFEIFEIKKLPPLFES